MAHLFRILKMKMDGITSIVGGESVRDPEDQRSFRSVNRTALTIHGQIPPQWLYLNLTFLQGNLFLLIPGDKQT